MEYDHLYKIILVGDPQTGKSQLLSRFCNDKFSDSYQPTVVMDHSRKMLTPKVCTHLWDLAGNDIFRTVTACYYGNADGVIVLYDITKVRSFENASRWIDHARDVLGPASPPILLLGNKLDLRHNRSIAIEEGQKLAKRKKTFFLETSAKDATNVQKAFSILTNLIAEKCQKMKSTNTSPALEQGSKNLVETRVVNKEPYTVVQSQPKSKVTLRHSAEHCLSVAKESCFKLPCLC